MWRRFFCPKLTFCHNYSCNKEYGGTTSAKKIVLPDEVKIGTFFVESSTFSFIMGQRTRIFTHNIYIKLWEKLLEST